MTMLNGVNFTRTGDPAADLKTYMEARGIDETTAKEELEAEFGIPETIESSSDEEVSLSDSNCSLCIDDTDTTVDTDDDNDGSSEFTKDATGRKKLQETIEYWNAKLKEATDARDSYEVTYAQKQAKKYQTLAYKWDHNNSSVSS